MLHDLDDLEIIKNDLFPVISESFSCGKNNGCDTKSSEINGKPEHELQCLLVKILGEFKTANIHIEQLCTILSKRCYEYYYNVPPEDQRHSQN